MMSMSKSKKKQLDNIIQRFSIMRVGEEGHGTINYKQIIPKNSCAKAMQYT